MISLVICEYKRPESTKALLQSITIQTLLPFEVIVVDGSPDLKTKEMLDREKFKLPITYIKVEDKDRGLTKQRNKGVQTVSANCDIVCFLDNDTVLDKDYFFEIQKSFNERPEMIGLNGYITDEKTWDPYNPGKHDKLHWYIMDGYAYRLSSRNYMRNVLGLAPDVPAGFIPKFSHGYDYFPPTGKTYELEHLRGGIAAYRKWVLEKITFSEYFIGYGLYEDFDFSVRASKYGKMYINTNAKLEHHHHPDGRPDTFSYGKMVTVNGWYVWRLKFPNPPFKAKIKWYSISMMLAVFLLSHLGNKPLRREFLGRMAGLFKVLFSPPKIEY